MDRQTERKSPSWTEAVERLQKGLGGLGKIAAGLLAVVLLTSLVWQQVRQDTVVVEPFEVPAELRDKGWNGKALANALVDELTRIEDRMGRASMGRAALAWSPLPPPDLRVEAVGFSTGALVEAIRSLSGRLRRVTAEVVYDGRVLELRVRATKNPVHCFRTELAGPAPPPPPGESCVEVEAGTAATAEAGLRRMLPRAAEELYLDIQPLTVAAAAFHSREPAEKCLGAVRRALTNDTRDDDARAYNIWGSLAWSEGRAEEAIRHFRRAVDAEPGLVQAYNNWAVVLSRKGRYEEAIRLLDRAARIDPHFADAQSNLGRILCSLGRCTKGLHHHWMAVRLDPRSSEILYNAAVGLENCERYDEAEQAFEMVEMLAPDDLQARLRWSMLVLSRRRGEDAVRAIAAFERTAQSDPSRCEPYLGLRFAHARVGNTRQVEELQWDLEACLCRPEMTVSLLLSDLTNGGPLRSSGDAAEPSLEPWPVRPDSPCRLLPGMTFPQPMWPGEEPWGTR